MEQECKYIVYFNDNLVSYKNCTHILHEELYNNLSSPRFYGINILHRCSAKQKENVKACMEMNVK